jgi:peptidyl-prolyl cis-trans isomerase D
MTGEIEKGYKPLELVKEEITTAVKNEIKGKMIIEKLNTINGSLSEMANAYSKDATIQNMSDLKLSANNMQSVGLDPQAIGVAFAPENGKKSKPFAAERGVLVVEMKNKTIAPAIADYTSYKTRIEQMSQNRNMNSITDAIKDKANIVDNRYKFY